MAGVAASNHVQEGERRTVNTKPSVVVLGILLVRPGPTE